GLTGEPREYVALANASAESLLAIINEVLDFSKIEANRLSLETVAFVPGVLLEDVAAPFAARARDRAFAFEWKCDPAVPSFVSADGKRIRQVLVNLIDNAFKFTERGKVAVSLTASFSRGEETILRFEVYDTGVGIPAGKQQLIFEPFSQADGSTTRRYGGTGL